MTPGAIAAGGVSVADPPIFGFNHAIRESFSSSHAAVFTGYTEPGCGLRPRRFATAVAGNLSDFYGTSASASLAGVAVLILAADPGLTATQVELIMEETAIPMSKSVVSSAGLVNVDAAIAATYALVTTVIESFGSTSLVEVGNNYFLDNISSRTGPELKYNGSAVTAGEFGTIAPIGAEQTSNGYDVAWKVPGADQYIVWSTDSGGNYLSNITGPNPVSGTSAALESLEAVLHQDLNGDGVIGVDNPTGVLAANNGTNTMGTQFLANHPLANSSR